MQLIQSGTKKLVSHADTVDQSRGCSCPTDDHGITASSAIIMSGVPSIAAMIARRRERQLCAKTGPMQCSKVTLFNHLVCKG
jgi:hypothetical protein